MTAFHWGAYWRARAEEIRCRRGGRTSPTPMVATQATLASYTAPLLNAGAGVPASLFLRITRTMAWGLLNVVVLAALLGLQWTLSCALTANLWSHESWVLAKTPIVAPAGNVFIASSDTAHANVRLRLEANTPSSDDVVLRWLVDPQTQSYLVSQKQWGELAQAANNRHLAWPSQQECVKKGACQAVQWSFKDAFGWLWRGQRAQWMAAPPFAAMRDDALTQRWFQGLFGVWLAGCLMGVQLPFIAFKRLARHTRTLHEQAQSLLLWATLLDVCALKRAVRLPVLIVWLIFLMVCWVEGALVLPTHLRDWGIEGGVALVNAALSAGVFLQVLGAQADSRREELFCRLHARLERGAVLSERAALRRAMRPARNGWVNRLRSPHAWLRIKSGLRTDRWLPPLGPTRPSNSRPTVRPAPTTPVKRRSRRL